MRERVCTSWTWYDSEKEDPEAEPGEELMFPGSWSYIPAADFVALINIPDFLWF